MAGLSLENLFSATATDTSSTVASSGSTPPTTVADTDSQHSDALKQDVGEGADAGDVIMVAADAADAPPAVDGAPQEPSESSPPASRRPRRARASEPVYNISKLSLISNNGKRRADGDSTAGQPHRAMSGDTLVGSVFSGARGRSKAGSDMHSSPDSMNSPRTRQQARLSPHTTRTSSRLSGAGVSSLGKTLASIRKRGKKAMKNGIDNLSRELRRLQDTNEFAGVEEKPVFHTVWSNGKFVDPKAPPPSPPKKAKTVAEENDDGKQDVESELITNTKQRRVKKYLEKGLYAGQDMPLDIYKGLTPTEKKKLTLLPELIPTGRANKTMPPPIYTGLRMLVAGRDFKLPFSVCNPLPKGQPKPEEWRKMQKNRFIGSSKDYWRKMPHLQDLSKCICKPEDGCGDNCQNRIMLYECDTGNCNVGKEHCTNRSFADLTARRAQGGKYRIGVEVIKTSDRGYGVRSNRCFEANQVIMEYTGEIITEEECERRMNEEYKNNECYYLMSFDQNMIIDATTGSIARFVNHSCNPNCRMVKWIVSGQPRMALFAGDKPIMTGDELTYDYNFDPFSAKNVQKCLCGSHNCRGVLGPRPRDVKPKQDIAKIVKAKVKAGKRKLKEMMGDEEADSGKGKKRKIAPVKGMKRSISSVSLKAAKGAASAIKKGVTSIAKSPAKNGRVKKGAVLKKKNTHRVVKRASKGGRAMVVSSRASSMTIVASAGDGKGKKGKASPAKGKASPAKSQAKASPSKAKPTVKKVQASPAKVKASTAKVRLTSGKGKAPAKHATKVSTPKSKATTPKSKVTTPKMFTTPASSPRSTKSVGTLSSPRRVVKPTYKAQVEVEA